MILHRVISGLANKCLSMRSKVGHLFFSITFSMKMCAKYWLRYFYQTVSSSHDTVLPISACYILQYSRFSEGPILFLVFFPWSWPRFNNAKYECHKSIIFFFLSEFGTQLENITTLLISQRETFCAFGSFEMTNNKKSKTGQTICNEVLCSDNLFPKTFM